jgi:hypothetical protein
VSTTRSSGSVWRTTGRASIHMAEKRMARRPRGWRTCLGGGPQVYEGAGGSTDERKKYREQILLRYVRVRYGRLPANTPLDALRKQAVFASRRQREDFSAVCFRKESESTMYEEKPMRRNAMPSANTFRVGYRP